MKTTQEKIEVMQAYINGQEIEVKTLPGTWKTLPGTWKPATLVNGELVWEWMHFDYRVKPRPPEVRVVKMLAYYTSRGDLLWRSELASPYDDWVRIPEHDTEVKLRMGEK